MTNFFNRSLCRCPSPHFLPPSIQQQGVPRKGRKKLLHLVKSVSSKLLCFCKQMMLSACVHIMASQTSSGRKQMHLILKQVQNMFFLILLEWLHDVGFAGTSKCVHFIGNPEPPWHQEQPPLKCSLRVWRQASIHHQRRFQLWYERHYVMSNLLWSGLFPLEVLILMCFSLWWTYIAAWLVHFADKFQSMILDWHTPRGRLHLFGLWCDAWEGATCPAGIPHDLTDWHDCFRLKWLQAIMSLTVSNSMTLFEASVAQITPKRTTMDPSKKNDDGGNDGGKGKASSSGGFSPSSLCVLASLVKNNLHSTNTRNYQQVTCQWALKWLLIG